MFAFNQAMSFDFERPRRKKWESWAKCSLTTKEEEDKVESHRPSFI